MYQHLLNKIQEVKELEKLQQDGDNFYCILKNHKDAADYFYEQSHGILRLSIFLVAASSLNRITLSIMTIDDGGIVFYGPDESKDKAVIRLEKVKDQIEEWGGWIPDINNCILMEKSCGMFWNR